MRPQNTHMKCKNTEADIKITVGTVHPDLGSITSKGKYFALRHRFQFGCGAQRASYPMGTEGCSLGGKAAGA
jgi:hypothetical protein